MTRREFTGAGSGMCATTLAALLGTSSGSDGAGGSSLAAYSFYSAPYSPQLLPLSPLGPLVQPTWRNPLPQGARRREGLLVPRHSALPTVEPRREAGRGLASLLTS